jgi:hypothetical protein
MFCESNFMKTETQLTWMSYIDDARICTIAVLSCCGPTSDTIEGFLLRIQQEGCTAPKKWLNFYFYRTLKDIQRTPLLLVLYQLV